MIKLFMLTCAITILSAPALLGSSNCEQKFTIVGKSTGVDGVLLWQLYVNGECEYSESYCLFLGGEHAYEMKAGGAAKEVFDRFLAGTPKEEPLVIAEEGGTYVLRDSATVAPPRPDSTFDRKFNKVVNEGGSGALDWYRACPVYCSDYPVFRGVEANLVYEFKGGLYKNYTFSQVLYFPSSGYLVIVTDQPLRAVGSDTMDGLLVYQLTKKGAQE